MVISGFFVKKKLMLNSQITNSYLKSKISIQNYKDFEGYIEKNYSEEYLY